MKQFNDKNIIDSWRKNSGPWIEAVQEGQIESRLHITNQAILDTILAVSPKTVMDIGCGEGWLARELSLSDISVSGLDIIPELVQEAKKYGRGKFYTMAYEDLSYSKINEKFDVAICNFSLLGKESVDHTFQVVPEILNRHGFFIVQTLHPQVSSEGHDYVDGWRQGTWSGFNSEFQDPAPWYFRTMDSWARLFSKNDLELVEVKEPVNPKTGKMASLIMVGKNII
jgi:2-polyprenyl-3-methyl-5-hydroxy-6-metoxy-1,4-benzoquinol methylase